MLIDEQTYTMETNFFDSIISKRIEHEKAIEKIINISLLIILMCKLSVKDNLLENS